VNNTLRTPITTPEQARAYLAWLVASGLDYHPEEHAANIVRGDGSPVFPGEYAALADARMDEVFGLLADPCAVLLDIYGTDGES
jgi:hypothetical protein